MLGLFTEHFADSKNSNHSRDKAHHSIQDRTRHRDSEKTREQRERDILSFEKIRVRVDLESRTVLRFTVFAFPGTCISQDPWIGIGGTHFKTCSAYSCSGRIWVPAANHLCLVVLI